MSQLECLPTFNPAIKIVDLDEDNPASQKSAKVEKSGREVKNGADHDVCGETGNEGNMAGFAMFEEQTAAKPEKPKCTLLRFFEVFLPLLSLIQTIQVP